MITEARRAERFLARVGIALRYGPNASLPLASLYRAFAGPEPSPPALTRAITLTNRLLGEAHGIEVHVIAGRVTLVHRSVMPALYALVRRGRPPDDLDGLGLQARAALSLLREMKQVTAGDVRRRLGLPSAPRRDPAYDALGELARALLVDRGPFTVPKAGIPYLSTEGYPYHLFHEVHADLAAASRRYTAATAADSLLEAYLRGAVFARVRKLGALFKAVLSAGEIEGALQRLSEKRKAVLRKESGGAIVVYTGKAVYTGPA